MSITVSFTSDSKRENSTKQLTMSATHDCTFKNGCSMLNPTLLLELETTTFPNYTAFKIENRYYNITDVRSVRNNLFEVSGEVDVLATYKSNILATTAYVIYDSTNNTELPDNRLPMKTTKSVQASTATFPFALSLGTYILSLTGSNGCTGIYRASESEIRALIDDVNNILDNFFPPSTPPDPSTYPNTITGMMTYWGDNFAYFNQRLKTAISNFFGSGNIPENIRECKYLPFTVGANGFHADPLYLGTFKTSVDLYQLANNTEYGEAVVSIPWQASDYRRRSPYTEIYLYLPYIGMVKLSSENLIGQNSITVGYALAIRNGEIVCKVKSGDEVLGEYSGNVGVEVPIGFSNTPLPKASQAVISGAASAISKNPIGTGMAAIAFGDAITPNYTCIGGLDGLASTALNQNIVCYTVFHDTIVAPNSELQTIGSPTMSPKPLATLTNYVQTMSASVDGAMTTDERTKLNNLLDAGIFIE